MPTFTIGLAMVVLGIILLLVEASSPGFFIAVPGTVLIFLGALGIITNDWIFSTIYAPIIAVVIAAPMMLFTIWLYRKLAEPEVPTTTVGDSLVGKRGIVTVKIKPYSHQGKIKIENTVWSAIADQEIDEGKEVEIIEGGVQVKVIEVKNEKEGDER